jgi:hypothetical protein
VPISSLLCYCKGNIPHPAAIHDKEVERGRMGLYFGHGGACMECRTMAIVPPLGDHVHAYKTQVDDRLTVPKVSALEGDEW